MVEKIIFLIFAPFIFEWIVRKTKAKVQSRYGPLYYSPSGIFQPLFDFFKLMFKEEIKVHSSPLSNLVYARLLLLIPYALCLSDFPYLLLILIIFLTFDSLLIAFIAFSYKSRFTIVGGGRLLIQKCIMEIPLFLSLILPSLLLGDFSIFKDPNLISLPFVALLLFISLAEIEFIPFDIPKAHTEIVKGWETELNAKQLATSRLCDNVKLVLLCLAIAGLIGYHPIILSFGICFILAFLSALFGRFKVEHLPEISILASTISLVLFFVFYL